MTQDRKLLFILAVLHKLAASDQERLDRHDTPVYVYAGEALQYIGEDIESIPVGRDEMNELIFEFNRWRREVGKLP